MPSEDYVDASNIIEQINEFESLLVCHRTIVLKVFLHITADEQHERLLEREQEPELHQPHLTPPHPLGILRNCWQCWRRGRAWPATRWCRNCTRPVRAGEMDVVGPERTQRVDCALGSRCAWRVDGQAAFGQLALLDTCPPAGGPGSVVWGLARGLCGRAQALRSLVLAI